MLYCLEHDLEIISDWFRANKLTLNVDKTVFMLFHPKGKRITEQIKFENKIILNSHETKFLGIWINDNLINQSHHNRLQKLQDSAIQLLDQYNPISTTYSKQNIPRLQKLIRLEQQKLGYCLVNNMLPVNLDHY